MELREEMKCYISFSDEDIFSGVALPEEPSIPNQGKLPLRVPNQHRPTPLSKRPLQR